MSLPGNLKRAAGALAVIAAAVAPAPQALASGPLQPFAARPSAAQPFAARPASLLEAVYCTAPENCWAVGEQDGTTSQLNHVLHWTGKKWSEVAVPSPGGTDEGSKSQLNAVRCVTAMDCWAVGEYFTATSAGLNQILHWNGRKWTVAAVPQPGGTKTDDFSELVDVACTGPDSCWASGGYGTFEGGSTIERNQALHWNGKTWTQVPIPNPAGTRANHVNVLLTIRCATSIDCWGVGAAGVVAPQETISNEMLHWNGKRWGQVTVPDPAGTGPGADNELFSLSCTSASGCWAAGFAEKPDATPGTATTRNQLVRWDGKAWREAAAPEPDGTGPGAINELFSLTCASAADCWAVGATGGQHDKAQLNQALHWNGKKWSAVTAPEPAGQQDEDFNQLNSVRCSTGGDCWAVGQQQHLQPPHFGQILHWTGKRWFVDTSSTSEH